jgi:outer membrane protein OmpA-like peptidoglycan-associated protein
MWGRVVLTGAVLAGLVYAMVLGVNWLTPQIENDIADRVTTALAERGLLWAEPQVVGRKVVVVGTAPDEAARAEAMKVVKGVFGVAEVSDGLVVLENSPTLANTKPVKGKKSAALPPYALTITKTGDDLNLQGQVPDEATLKVLQRVAETHYGAEHVNTEGLIVAEGAPAGWRTATGALVMHITNLENGTVQLSQTEVMLGGQVLTAEFASKMEENIRAVLPSTYKVAFAVEVVTPTQPAMIELASRTSTPKVADSSAVTVSDTVRLTTVESLADIAPAPGQACTEADQNTQLAKHKVIFDFDKAEVRADQRTTIRQVAKVIKPCANVPVVVAGYTDATGSPLYNRWLSEQRAQASQRALIRAGVSASQLTAVGYGDAHPAASNATRAGRIANRRVEFTAGAAPHALPVSTLKGAAKTSDVAVSATVAKASASAIAKPWWAQVGALLNDAPASTSQPTITSGTASSNVSRSVQ